MTNEISTTIKVSTAVNAPIEKVWKAWTLPNCIKVWYHASDAWHAPYAENDLRKGGRFKTTMAAIDGSFSFDFEGVYTEVIPFKRTDYTIPDGRKVSVTFEESGKCIKVTESFETETENPIEQQRKGWQTILDNFKNFTETL
jgi:uncharacterized protein YndB with AHSA1/START domain